MRYHMTVIKWMAMSIRPFVLPLSSIIILKSVSSLCAVAMAVVSKNLIDAAVLKNWVQTAWMAAAFGALILLQTGIRAAAAIVSARSLEALSNNMRKNLFIHLSQARWPDFLKYHSDDVLTRMTSDVSVTANGLVNVLPDIVSLGVGLAAAFTALLFYDPVLAVLAFVLGPAAVLFSRFFGRRLKQSHIKMQETESAYRSFLHESIQNMLVVKAFQLEDDSVRRIEKLQDERLGWAVRRSRTNAAAGSILSFGYWLGYFLAFGWGALRLSTGAATFGTFTAFLQLVGQVQSPFAGLAYTFPQLISSTASAGRLMELEALQPENSGNEMPGWTSAGIRLDNVSFAYEEENPVLRNISVEIDPGETVALIGASGEGKTTFISLLLSLVHPSEGCIYFTDGRDRSIQACASSRALISYVPQGNTLFSGTIAENLRAGHPDASDLELETAARAACAWEFIEELPDGILTKVGERGLGLSEGQAQRLAISRALLHKTPVLILDEATSALDVKTEMRILQAVRGLNPTRTCIVITHRTTALEICHRVLKLDDGYLSEYPGGITAGPASEAV